MDETNLPPRKNRLDVEVARRGLARSRSLAADLIKRGKVNVNGNAETKPSFELSETDSIDISGGSSYVSRAGEKLAAALSAFKLDVSGLEAVDIGSSTGGFSDCLLRNGAKKVIAIDVGTDQFDASLRDDPRIELHEGTDVRKFALASPVDLATLDVSFISLTHVLPKAFELVKKDGAVVALVKPQFEVGKETADRFKGVIWDDKERLAALENVKSFAQKVGFKVAGSIDSPLEGEKGNREFLLLLRK